MTQVIETNIIHTSTYSHNDASGVLELIALERVW